MSDNPDTKAVLERETVTGSHATGNAAAMREALEYAAKQLIAAIEDDTMGGNVLYLAGCMRVVANKCRAALAAPPRNCDKMPDIDRLTMYDLAKSPCKSTLECASREELLALVRWLLAPAKEGDAK